MKWKFIKLNVITHIKHKWKHFYWIEMELMLIAEFIDISHKGALFIIAGNHMGAKS